MKLELLCVSSPAWLNTVLADFDTFLCDHASCEKKASGMAMSLIGHYPDKPILIRAMLNLAVEELSHFREVMRLILDRGLKPTRETRDDYVNKLQQLMDQGKDMYLLDRLLLVAIVEARGAERFGLIADALPAGKLKTFYQSITESENRHYELFLDLAQQHYPGETITLRLPVLLKEEARILTELPLKAALH
ncbi:MAG: tRNA-(ms[2]io[6]A)-hydroxylase [Pseudomonadota bacterium]